MLSEAGTMGARKEQEHGGRNVHVVWEADSQSFPVRCGVKDEDHCC